MIDHDVAEAFLDHWVSVSNARDWQRWGGLVTDGVVITDPMSTEAAVGRAAALARAQAQYAPFDDGAVERTGGPYTGMGHELAYRWRFTGTHTSRIDPPGFAATGRRVRVDGVSVLRLVDGQVDRADLFFDATAVARQIGAAPAAGSRTERLAVLVQRLRTTAERRGGGPSGSAPGRAHDPGLRGQR